MHLLIAILLSFSQLAYAEVQTPGINSKQAIAAPDVILRAANMCKTRSIFLDNMGQVAPNDLFALKKTNAALGNFLDACKNNPDKCPKNVYGFVSNIYPRAIKELKQYVSKTSNNLTTKVSFAKIICHLMLTRQYLGF